MAWISVHEEVIGGKLRRLQKEIGCSQNEALGIIVRLWLWSIGYADENGNVDNATREDVEDALTQGLQKNLYADEVVDALIKTEWIRFDSNLVLDEWEKWQKEWYKESRARIAASKRQAEYRARKKNAPEKPPKAVVSEDKQQTLTPTQEQPKEAQKKEYSKDFKDFWEIYPRRVDKGSAYTKYQARLKDGWRPEELKLAAENYAKECRRLRTEPQYIKHPKTFLSEKTPFEDYLPKNKDSGEKKAEGGNPFSMFRR